MGTMETQTDIQTETQFITITPEAANEIKKIREANQIPDSHALRVGVKSGGCCGVSYFLAFDDKEEAADKILQSEGIKLLIDEQSLSQLTGVKLDFVDGPQGRGFKFDNPNAEKSCNCDDGCCG